ncbi:MAG: hypothetical protein A2048_10740 [Deltaproteobacteria bacterium GWA2_45_12]|nr:MAG: hypothetical protein A2048_10740 [Deltaproteobacteria bacterium GWA2_45_12]
MKGVSINQIVDSLIRDNENPLDTAELSQVELLLTDLESAVGDGNQEVSYEEWLRIKSSPEYGSLFENDIFNSDYPGTQRNHVSGTIQVLFATPPLTAKKPAANVTPPPQITDLSDISELELNAYTEQVAEYLLNDAIPLQTRLFHGEVSAKLLIKADHNLEAASVYETLSTLAPKNRSYPEAVERVSQLEETTQNYFSEQHKQKNAQNTLVTLLLSSQVIYDWLMQGMEYQESWIGEAEHFWLPEHSAKTYIAKVKPLLTDFLKKWEYLASTGNFNSTTDIFREIEKGDNNAAEGCKIFQEMIFLTGSGKHNLGYTHHYAIKAFIDAERIQDPAEKTKHILENTNQWLLTNGESYGAAYQNPAEDHGRKPVGESG